jgi:hypothetical protein
MTQDEIIEMAREACPYTSESLRGAFYDGFVKASKLVAVKYETALADYIQHVRDCEGTDFISDIDWLDNKTSVEIIKKAAK